MAIIAKFENQDCVEYTKSSNLRAGLRYISERGDYCVEVRVTDQELTHLMLWAKGLPNLSGPEGKEMYFVGDWAKMIARNILLLFPEHY